jgi:hypothetical protein
VAIDVHGSLDRVKDVSSEDGERAFSRLPFRVRALWRTLTTFPSSHSRGHPLSPVRSRTGGETHCLRSADRPRPTFPRQPAKAAGILWIRVPSTVATTSSKRGLLHSLARVGLSLTPPTRCPQAGDKCFEWALRASLQRSSRSSAGHSRERCAFTTRRFATALACDRSRLGLTTQARLHGSVCVAFRES